jgi:tryptophan synthase beta chain
VVASGSGADEIVPRYFYNIVPELPEKLPPPLNPATGKPAGPDELAAIFPLSILRQEMSSESRLKIPDELREQYIKMGRPRPLVRAEGLERSLDLPDGVRIFYKREDLSPVGSHKLNTALAQAYYAAKEGVERYTTETGAGQWGSALSLACCMNDIKCLVYMVKVSYETKPYRRIVMRLYGADVIPSPSTTTEIGRRLLKQYPGTPGTLGMAISEAVEVAAKDERTKYSLGSVLNHVLMHQTIIGLEAKEQLRRMEIEPDVLVGCVGGGSNFAGFAYPFISDKIRSKAAYEIIAVEPDAVPSMTRGEYRYDSADTGGLTPLLKMHTIGHEFVPDPIHAGGLRYHGIAPTLSILINHGLVKPVAYSQKRSFDAGRLFARSEGIIPAPESNFAIASVIDRALEAKKKREEKNIVFNLSGHGLLDLKGYEDVLGL